MPSDLHLIDLSSCWALLRVSGADADTFLQGQLGNDLRKLSLGRSQISSYSSPKGRMLATMTLSRDVDASAVDIELPRPLAEAIARRLRMFVLRSKVQIADAPLSLLGLRGPGASAALTAAGLPVPSLPLQTDHADGLRVMRRFGSLPRYSLYGPADRLDAVRGLLIGASGADEPLWRYDDVVAGVPVVLPATQDHFVAQMTNLDRLDGISFDKGCYTGQEIVARLHYLGQLKRRMYCCRGQGPAPEAGAPVYDGSEPQAVGEVALAAPAPEGDGFVAAVVLQISQAAATTLRVGETSLSVPTPYDYMQG